jgi:hypothetical protein
VEAAKAEYRATHTRAAVDAEVNQVVGLVAAGEPFPLSMAPEGWKLLAAVPHAEPDVQVMTLEAELSRLTAEMQYYPIAQQRTADMLSAAKREAVEWMRNSKQFKAVQRPIVDVAPSADAIQSPL